MYIGFIYEFYSYQQTYKFLKPSQSSSPFLVLHTECIHFMYSAYFELLYYEFNFHPSFFFSFTMATLFILFLLFSCYSCVSDLFSSFLLHLCFSNSYTKTNTLNINSLYIFITINMGNIYLFFPHFPLQFLGLVSFYFFFFFFLLFHPKLFFFFFFFFIIIHFFRAFFSSFLYPVSLFYFFPSNLYVGYTCSVYILAIWNYIYFVGYNIFHSM